VSITAEAVSLFKPLAKWPINFSFTAISS
jgi:hypothetical protein